MKAVRTLGYDQPADVTIRKTLGLHMKVESMSLFDSEQQECAINSQLALCFKFCISLCRVQSTILS